MTADNDPMPAIRALLHRLAQETQAMGLDMGQAAIIPSPDGRDMLQTIFIIRPSAVDTRDKQAIDDERAVEEIFARSQEAEFDERNQTIIKDVQGWLDEH